jgi:Glyoxalase-like domain
MLRIDHVVLAVRDLDASAERLWDEHGLRFVAGGRHPRWGTANMIAPLGSDYVELLGVVDQDAGSKTVLGAKLMELSADGDRWFSVCLADDDIDATAARLGLEVQPGARTRPDGTEVRWRGAGIEERGVDLWLPFFISWDVPAELHPGAAPANHRVEAEGIAWAEVGGDEARLRDWLGDADSSIRVVDGANRRVRAVGISLHEGSEIVLRG